MSDAGKDGQPWPPEPPMAVPIDRGRFGRRREGDREPGTSRGLSRSISSSSSSNGSSDSRNETAISSPDRTVPSQEPTTASQEPTTASQEPTTASQEPTTASQEPTVAASAGRGRDEPSCSFYFDFPAVRIKEEPRDEDELLEAGDGDGDGGPRIAISCVAGNADDQWGLQSSLELEDEVKQECFDEEGADQAYEGYGDDLDLELNLVLGDGFSEQGGQPDRVSLSPEVVPLSPRREEVQYEVVDLEAEWQGETWSPPESLRRDDAVRAADVPVKSEPACPAGASEVAVKREPTSPKTSARSEAAVVSPPRTPVRVKEERREDDEEAGRAQLFGTQEHDDDGEGVAAAAQPGADRQVQEDEVDDPVQEEVDRQAEGEEDADSRPPRSTTLHPAVTSELIDKMKEHVAKFVQEVAERNAKEHEASVRAAKALARRHPHGHDARQPKRRDSHHRHRVQPVSSSSSTSSPSVTTSSSSPSTSPPSSPGSSRGSPATKRCHSPADAVLPKKVKREVLTPSPPRRKSLSSSDEGGSRRRVAHKAPQGYDEPSTSASACVEASTSRGDPRLRSRSRSRDPRLQPRLKRPDCSSSSEDVEVNTGLSEGGADAKAVKVEVKREDSPPHGKAKRAIRSAFAPAPASVKKRRLQDLSGGGDLVEAKVETKLEAKVVVEAALKLERCTPSPSPSPPPAKARKAVTAVNAPAPASVKKKRSQLPVLPAAQYMNLSPHYESRSPLYVEDAPRKSYYSGQGDSSESKAVSRPFSAPSWLDDVLYFICRWRPEWLSESKQVSRDKVPDLLPDMTRFETEERTLSFSSTDGYLKHFQEGLLLEMWETLRKEKFAKRVMAEVEGLPHDKPLLGNRTKRTYTCHCGSNNQKNPFRPGDVVIVDVEGESSETIKPFFAYVDIVIRAKMLSDTVKLSSKSKGKEHNFKCGFKLSMCFDQFPDETFKVIQITKVRNFYEEVETFKFLSDFLVHDLAPLVFNPMHSTHAEPAFGLKTGSDLCSTQKPVVLSVIQDIVNYEAPSISVVEGGPGTGKTHIAAALAQELVERKHKPERDCYVIVAAKTNNQLDIILEKLQARNSSLSSSVESKDPDAFRAVWLGNDNTLKGGERLKRISVQKLALKHSRSFRAEPLRQRMDQLMKGIHRNDRKLKQLESKNLKNAALASETAKMRLDLTLVTEQLEKNSSLNRSENAVRPILDNCDIVLTTLSCNHYRSETQDALLKRKPRKHVVLIVDDATEITEPSIIKLIVIFGVTDVVLLGDMKQHTPYVSSKWARNSGLVVSLMRRYTQALQKGQCFTNHRTLTKQIRMHPDILRGINKVFYDSTMKPATEFKKFVFRPYIWFNCTYFSEGSEKYAEETKFVVKLLSAVLKACKVYRREDMKKRVRVMSFCKPISARLSSNDKISDYCEIPENISSMECDILILSVGPLKLRIDKTISALTRARKSLFICGNFQGVSPRLLPVIKDAREHKCLDDITNSDIEVDHLIKKILP